MTGLWTVVQPCARPTKIETLNKKRLAVDASIWIYQFLKAVRDKEGNALRNSHVVGFFRRVCKLLFFGIKPVFVFDGGAPILKRQTVTSRKAKREGRREDAVRTAGKLLAVQMQRRAEEDDRKRREYNDRPAEEQQEEEVPENLVYVDELQMSAQERQQNRTFKKKDAYHLPNLDVDLTNFGAPNDPRIMSHEELEEYARQFHTGEDINVYDFSKIDFNSPFFLSLPASDRYNILNAARLRSRLRMGYSKEQLDTMFPNRMAFSKFQIDRVKERNELTQRLMNLNGMNGEDAMNGFNNRVAGEKGKEYVLVKNDGVEGGWALGVVSNKNEGERNKPIDVERYGKQDEVPEDDELWEDDGFEDVPIEGLNRLPRRSRLANGVEDVNMPFASEEVRRRRQEIYEARKEAAGAQSQEDDTASMGDQDESLFVPQDKVTFATNDDEADTLFEDVPMPAGNEEQEELDRAIAMSLEDADAAESSQEKPTFSASANNGPRIDQPLEFNQRNAAVGRNFAHLTNARAHGSAPKPFADSSDEDDNIDLESALNESRQTKYKPRGGPEVYRHKHTQHPSNWSPKHQSPDKPLARTETTVRTSGFDGPLPFESLDLGTSILGRKKMKQRTEEQAGGFDKESNEEKAAKPAPPWFSGDIREAAAAQKAIEEKQDRSPNADGPIPSTHDTGVLMRQQTGEVIDLDAPNEATDKVIDVDSSDEDNDDVLMQEIKPADFGLSMGDVADKTRAEPPIPEESQGNPPVEVSIPAPPVRESATPSRSDSEEPLNWSDSDHEVHQPKAYNIVPSQDAAGDPTRAKSQALSSKSSTPEFEDVAPGAASEGLENVPKKNNLPASLPREQSSIGQGGLDDLPADDEDIYSDPEEEDLMRQLAIEAEEHARFASTLNSKSQLQNAEDYEKELRQLRNQQKKDRRDADEVTHIMVTECQQLLKLFGLPYITAPMEAEAQCAELVNLGLVDGIVTDDSDIFLFGGTRIYKNMFNQAKFVECYLSSDLEKEYSLDRRKLIRIAHLLGSDYTEGLPNVGPVTALEILSEFETLEQFAEWWGTVQMGQPLSAQDASNPFRRKFRKNATKLFLPAVFPDTRVDLAYLHPEVDKDPSAFQWGVPDLDALRSFLMATIGWTQDRTDEVLVPVIRDINRRENEGTQANITRFFEGGVGVGGKPSAGSSNAFAPRRRLDGKSKRMESALGRLHEQARNRTIGENETSGGPLQDPADVAEESSQPVSATNGTKEPKSSQAKRKKNKRAASPDLSDNAPDSLEDDEYQAPKKARKKARQPRSKGTRGTTTNV